MKHINKEKLNNYNDINIMCKNNKNIYNIFKNADEKKIDNFDNFITFFKKDFHFENEELRFIITLFFEDDFFIECLNTIIDMTNYKRIIGTKVSNNINEISDNDIIIKKLALDAGFCRNSMICNYNTVIEINEKIYPRFSLCYLFDNIKNFNTCDEQRICYLNHLTIILENFINNTN